MPKQPVRSVLLRTAICLVLLTMLWPVQSARTEDVLDGLYLKDDRGYEEIGLFCHLDLQQTSPGRWQVRITAANPALCGGVVEGEARLDKGVAIFRDVSCPDQSDSGDCCVLELTFSKDAITVAGPACLAEQCPLEGVYYRYGVLVQPVDQVIKDIRTHFYQTNKIIDQLDLDQKEINSAAHQPHGLVKVYSNMGYPKKMVVDLQGPGPRLVEEYYYFDNVLLFCFRLTYPDLQQGVRRPRRVKTGSTFIRVN